MTTKFFSHLSKKRQNSGRKEGDQRPEVLEQTGVPISAVPLTSTGSLGTMLEVSVLSVLTYNMGALNYSLKRLVRRVTHQSAVSNKNKIKAFRMAFFLLYCFPQNRSFNYFFTNSNSHLYKLLKI